MLLLNVTRNKQTKINSFVILGSVFVKLILNIPLIMIFHTSGAVLSTAIALMVANVANLMILKVYAKFHFTDTLVQVAKIFIYSLIMMISVEVVYFLLSLFISVDRKSGAFIILIIGVIVGGLIYGTITIKNRLADEFLGIYLVRFVVKLDS